jgi:hypothetical protein
LLCYLPYVYLALFYSFVIRAIIKIGKIPTHNNPDPKDLKFDVHREIIYRAFDWLVYGLILFAVLFLISIIAKKFNVKKTHLVLLIIGVTGILLHLFLDPFDTWFLD